MSKADAADAGTYGVALVRIGTDEYRIPGLTEARLRRALVLLSAAEQLQSEVADSRREGLVRAMIVANFDPVPEATIRQARRLAAHREDLLASGAYTMEALARLRGDSTESATRTWLARRRQAREMFSVANDNTTLVPAFQLDEAGNPIAGLRPVLATLIDAGLGGWALWTWLTATSPWLGGKRPVALLEKSPRRVEEAAERFAANVA